MPAVGGINVGSLLSLLLYIVHMREKNQKWINFKYFTTPLDCQISGLFCGKNDIAISTSKLTSR